MMDLNCEYVCETYPDVLSGNAETAVATSVRAHIATCAECRRQAALLEALREQYPQVPAGLSDRVIRAAAAPRSRWRISRVELAIAATVAAALIGGTVIMNRMDTGGSPSQVHMDEARAIGSVGVEGAMLTGKTSLDDLSVEQLELLLREMES